MIILFIAVFLCVMQYMRTCDVCVFSFSSFHFFFFEYSWFWKKIVSFSQLMFWLNKHCNCINENWMIEWIKWLTSIIDNNNCYYYQCIQQQWKRSLEAEISYQSIACRRRRRRRKSLMEKQKIPLFDDDKEGKNWIFSLKAKDICSVVVVVEHYDLLKFFLPPPPLPIPSPLFVSDDWVD